MAQGSKSWIADIFQTRYREITLPAIVFGIVIGVVMNAAITYSGLKIGFTLGGSAIAAVLGWGVLRGLLRKGTIIENNIAQTIASSVNTSNSGVIFTVPVLFILGVDFRSGLARGGLCRGSDPWRRVHHSGAETDDRLRALALPDGDGRGGGSAVARRRGEEGSGSGGGHLHFDVGVLLHAALGAGVRVRKLEHRRIDSRLARRGALDSQAPRRRQVLARVDGLYLVHRPRSRSARASSPGDRDWWFWPEESSPI